MTVTDSPANSWFALRQSWWWPTWMTITVVWSLSNIFLCAIILLTTQRSLSLATVVVSIELTANISTYSFDTIEVL